MQVIKENSQGLLQISKLSFKTICKTGLVQGGCVCGVLNVSKLKRGPRKRELFYFFTLQAKRCNLPFKISQVFQLRKQAEVQSLALQGTSTTYFQVRLHIVFLLIYSILDTIYYLQEKRMTSIRLVMKNNEKACLPPTLPPSLSPIGRLIWSSCSLRSGVPTQAFPQRLLHRLATATKFWQILAHPDHAVLLPVLVTLSVTAGKSTCMEGEKEMFQIHSENLLLLLLSPHMCR